MLSFKLKISFLQKRWHHQIKPTHLCRSIDDPYFFKTESGKDIWSIRDAIWVKVICIWLLLRRIVYSLNIYRFINNMPIKNSNVFWVDYCIEDIFCPYDDPINMRVSLRANCYCGSHAAFTKSLRVRQVLFAILIDKESLSWQRRQTFSTRLFMRTLAEDAIEKVGKFIILKKMLAFRAGLIIWMIAKLYISILLHRCYPDPKHLKHFIWAACLHFSCSV